MFLYSMPALFVFLWVYDAMRKDETVPNDDLTNWTFLILAGVLWPVTLPCILRKKAMRLYESLKGETRVA